MRVEWKPLAKLGAFCASGAASALLVVNTLSMPVPGHTVNYTAQFHSVEGLNVGNPVTMNGIRIGRVEAIRFTENGAGTSRADVDIEVDSARRLTTHVNASVRYGDMLGARYIALADPDGRVIPLSTGSGPTILAAGATIPLSQTAPAVDLTALLNGFKPLFDALNPQDVNTLTRGFVETFAGQTQTLTTLLVQIASMTKSLNDNRDIFAHLIANMTTLLHDVSARGPQVQNMLAGLQRLSSSVLSGDDELSTLIDQGNAVLATLDNTVNQTGDAYGNTISGLKTMLDSWQGGTGEFTQLLGRLPEFADAVNRASSYGGFVSLYLCNFTIKIAKHEANIFGHRHSEVCQ